MQPNANLTFLHLVALSGAMLAIIGWGLICLEAELSRHAPRVVISAELRAGL